MLVFRPLSVRVRIGPFGCVVTLIALGVRSFLSALLPVGSSIYRPAPLLTAGAGALDEPFSWLSLGISLRFAREHIAALEIDASHSADKVRSMLHSSGEFGAKVGVRSHVELYRDTRTLDGRYAVGEANVFVISAPDLPFVALIDALSAYSAELGLHADSTFFWIGAFSRRPIPLRARELAATTRIIHRVAHVALVLGCWHEPAPLRSLRCTYLLGCCRGVQVRLALTACEHARFASTLREQPAATREALLLATTTSALESDDEGTRALVLDMLTNDSAALPPHRLLLPEPMASEALEPAVAPHAASRLAPRPEPSELLAVVRARARVVLADAIDAALRGLPPCGGGGAIAQCV